MVSKKHIEFKDLMLLIMILLVCMTLWGYGAFLKYEGAAGNANSPCEMFAYAITNIHDGVYPWNYEEKIDPLFCLGISGETSIGIRSNTNISESEETSLEESSYEMTLQDEVTYNSDENSQKGVGLVASLNSERIFSDLDLYNIKAVPLSGLEAAIYENQNVAESEEGLSENSETEDVILPELEFETVDDTYFDDAVFLGDSRMVGVYEYAGMNNATFFAKTAMTIYGLLDTVATTDPLGRTAREGLTDTQYGKIYIMVGINEIGTGDTAYFVNKYSSVIDEIRELQPDAIIYIQGIMHVAHNRDSIDAYVNNRNINERNQALSQLADGQRIFYIDVNPVFDDVNGDLTQEYTSDDIHLYATHYATWHTFYLEHAIVLP